MAILDVMVGFQIYGDVLLKAYLTKLSYIVICHDIILSSAIDTTLPLATRRGCYMALDALEGDPEFLTRTCDCRAILAAERAERRRVALQQRQPASSDAAVDDSKSIEGKEQEEEKVKEDEPPEVSSGEKDDDEIRAEMEIDGDADDDEDEDMEDGDDEANP